MTAERQGYLSGSSQASRAVTDLVTELYDAALIAPGWDARCCSIMGAAHLRVRTCLVLVLPTFDPYGKRHRNERALMSFLRERSEDVVLLQADPNDRQVLWEALWSALRQLAAQNSRPVSLLMDLSTCPRFYSLAALAGCFKHALTSRIDVLYTEGEYAGDPTAPAALQFQFSLGEWTTVPVPFLEGTADPWKKRYLLVSLGFEGPKTSRVLSREDPDRISVLLGDPGTRAEYPAVAERGNSRILHTYQVPAQQIVRVAAADAIAVWRRLREASLERPDSENTFYLPCGTKPHALGLALRALCLGFPTVLYNAPDAYNFVDVQPTGIYWRYRIEDLSFPCPGAQPMCSTPRTDVSA